MRIKKGEEDFLVTTTLQKIVETLGRIEGAVTCPMCIAYRAKGAEPWTSPEETKKLLEQIAEYNKTIQELQDQIQVLQGAATRHACTSFKAQKESEAVEYKRTIQDLQNLAAERLTRLQVLESALNTSYKAEREFLEQIRVLRESATTYNDWLSFKSQKEFEVAECNKTIQDLRNLAADRLIKIQVLEKGLKKADAARDSYASDLEGLRRRIKELGESL